MLLGKFPWKVSRRADTSKRRALSCGVVEHVNLSIQVTAVFLVPCVRIYDIYLQNEQVPQHELLEPFFRYTNRDVQGMKFVDMLSSIVDNIHTPEFIFNKISEMAPMHHRLGVNATQMPAMSEMLQNVFANILGESFTQEDRSSWTFLWDFMTVAMQVTGDAVGSSLTLVRDSWDQIMERYSSEIVGGLVYEHLFALVPNVATIFTKPMNEMAIKMGNMLVCMFVWVRV